jgi:hypothetical protein
MTPGWAVGVPPSGEWEFKKTLLNHIRARAEKWLTANGWPTRGVSDAQLAGRIAHKLGHTNPVGTHKDYLLRCDAAKVFAKPPPPKVVPPDE